MLKPVTRLSLATVAMFCAAAPAAAADTADLLAAYRHQGHVVQQLKQFDNPEAAIFSADGRYVFISNTAELGMPDKGFNFTQGGGYISKLAVQPDGTLVMVNDQLISNLTAPVGMAVLPVDTAKFPKDTIFVVEATAPLATAEGTPVTDPKAIDPKIIAFNEEGKVLGAIKLGAGSPVHKATGTIATLGNALAFDKQGNLYLAETGIGGGQFNPPLPTTGGGVYMFPRASLDALADGKDAELYYVPVPEGGPDGIAVAPDGTVHFNTVGQVAGLKDPAQGGMYRMRSDDFKQGRLPKPFNQGLGALDGLDFAGSARLDTEIKNSNSHPGDAVLDRPLLPFAARSGYQAGGSGRHRSAPDGGRQLSRGDPRTVRHVTEQQGQSRHRGAAARRLRPLPAGHRRTDVAKRQGILSRTRVAIRTCTGGLWPGVREGLFEPAPGLSICLTPSPLPSPTRGEGVSGSSSGVALQSTGRFRDRAGWMVDASRGISTTSCASDFSRPRTLAVPAEHSLSPCGRGRGRGGRSEAHSRGEPRRRAPPLPLWERAGERGQIRGAFTR